MSTNHPHLSDVLQQHLDNYRHQHPMDYQQQNTCRHILNCRTEKLGTQKWHCNECEHQEIHYCSCRDRHCPKCQGRQTQQWIEKQQAQVINSRYFHLVFTLPHELNVITQYAPKTLYRCLFKATWQTLSQFAHNRKKLKGQLGITAVLHTWGQTLSQHIHLHCLVPGGVINQHDKWQGVQTNYLFPVKAVSTVFRAKMLAALRQENINIPNSETLMSKPWCVYSKPCFNKPDTVIKYLARYTKKGILNETRLKVVTKQSVTFSYKDYQDHSQHKLMTLTGSEFIRRYLSHILPKGFMRIRHFGYLASRCRKRKIRLIQQQTKLLKTKLKQDKQSTPTCWHCPKCKHGLLSLKGLNLPSSPQTKIETLLTG